MYLYQYGSQKPKKKWPFILLTFLVAVTGSYAVQTYMMKRLGNEDDNAIVERLSNTEISKESIKEVTYNRADIIENAMKSVVGISMLQATEESIFDANVTEKWGMGTGIIVSEDGYVLTNQHLARKVGGKVTVNLDNGKSLQGKVLWTEEDIDLAIVKINEENLQPADLGDSDKIRIGDDVMAIGNPLGVEFQRTTTNGIVSGVNRTLTFDENGETVFMEDLIQTDASINSGNSGGPLINSSGEVIGINTVKITSAEGIGFAVPINVVVPVINKFISNGKFKEATLGILAYDKEIVKYTKSNISVEDGIYVVGLTKNGPAEKAGIKEKDVLVSIDGVKLEKVMDLREYIYTKEPGDEVSLIINRNNKIEDIKVRLE